MKGFPGGIVVKNLSVSEGGSGSIPGSGRSPGGGNDNPLQYSCLGNPMDRRTWCAAVHGAAKGQTWLSNWTTELHNKESCLTLLPPVFPKIIDQRTHFGFSHNTSYFIYQLVNFIFYSTVQKCYPLVVNQTTQNVIAIANVIHYVFIKLDMKHLFWITYSLTISVIYWQKQLLLIYLEDTEYAILAIRETLSVKVKVKFETSL